jgi:hypothetical protein
VTRRLRIRREHGFALPIVVLLIAVLSLISVTLLELTKNETVRSAQAERSSASFQAAEAGVDDYITKLLDDPSYYDHYVHPGESTRLTSGGSTVAAGTDEVSWPGGKWTYPNGKDHYRTNKLNNGYEYNLEVYPPDPVAGTKYARIVSTGRKAGSTTDQRAVEVWMRPSNASDFQLIGNADNTYGPTATSYGKLYVTGWNSTYGRYNNLTHNGTAYGNLYAEGKVNGTTTMMSGAKKFDSTTVPDIRSEIKDPAVYTNFSVTFEDVKKAAQLNGNTYLNQPSYDAWEITLRATGQFRVRRCTRNGSNALAQALPTCTSTCTGCGTFSVPSNGAIYSEQPVIVSGSTEASVVDGRVTVASAVDVVIANNITYETVGDDVLGLAAKQDIVVAKWSPNDINWRAATLALSGTWRSYDGCMCKGKAVFTGSEISNTTGYMSMFTVREYWYDDSMLYLPPPWFPTLPGSYTILLFRELKP